MTTVDIDGVIFWGANARSWGRPLADNPFPESPGWYVKRKAWAYGWRNAIVVLAQHYQEDPNAECFDDLRAVGAR